MNNFYQEIINLDFEEAKYQGIINLNKVLGSLVGEIFTFQKFVYFLAKISIYIFSDPNNIPKKFRLIHFTTDEKLYMLMERMEISSGFSRIPLKKTKYNKDQTLTLRNKDLAYFHKENYGYPNFEKYLDQSDETTWMLLNFDFNEIKPERNYILNKL